MVWENRRRKALIFTEYDPLTGVGCWGYPGRRVKVCLPDCFIPEMWVPQECMETHLFRGLAEWGSVRGFIEHYMKREYSPTLSRLVQMELCKTRAREDPEFAMYLTDKIEDKVTGDLIPFRLNYPQRKLLSLMEDIRHRGEAIRVIILKARQWGGSTLSQLYIKWMQDYRHDGWNAIILSQVKGTSKKIKAMYRKALQNQPGWTIGYPGVRLQLSPFENSTDDFVVSDGIRTLRRSTLTVASFDNFDNVRGSNFHCAHYSEVAYWKKTPEHDPEGVISSISAGIRNQADNIEIFESTGRGASGFFYDKCQQAMSKDNNDAYHFIFIPFYDIENDMEAVADEHKFAKWLYEHRNLSSCPLGFREEGKFFFRMWKLGATFEAINWYRHFRNKFMTHAFMATEAPVDEVEAFRSSGNLIFNPYSIDAMQQEEMKEPLHYGRIVVAMTKSGKDDVGVSPLQKHEMRSKKTIRSSRVELTDGRAGDLKIWALPNNEVMKVRHRYLVSVDIGGTSSRSDYSVFTVVDRMGMIKSIGDKPAVVARWRGHLRHDLLAWHAAALAHYYDDALLVIESNTSDRERGGNTEGDHFGTIIEEISGYYPNLYQRNSLPDNVRDRIEMKYGFHTNKLTKSWVIDNLLACVDDMLYHEPDAEMYRELRIYERREDGSMGNIEGAGNHDDVLMSTGIAMWVCFNDMPKPEWIRKSVRKKKATALTEASM